MHPLHYLVKYVAPFCLIVASICSVCVRNWVGVWGRNSPSGFQGKSPGRGPRGQSFFVNIKVKYLFWWNKMRWNQQTNATWVDLTLQIMGDTRVSVPWSKFFVFFGGGAGPLSHSDWCPWWLVVQFIVPPSISVVVKGSNDGRVYVSADQALGAVFAGSQVCGLKSSIIHIGGRHRCCQRHVCAMSLWFRQTIFALCILLAGLFCSGSSLLMLSYVCNMAGNNLNRNFYQLIKHL